MTYSRKPKFHKTISNKKANVTFGAHYGIACPFCQKKNIAWPSEIKPISEWERVNNFSI
jgi:hypothetical protein